MNTGMKSAAVVVALVVMGFGGYYLGNQAQENVSTQQDSQRQDKEQEQAKRQDQDVNQEDSFSSEVELELRAFPEAGPEESRFVIFLDPMPAEVDRQVEIFVGKEVMVDCNGGILIGNFEEVDLEGWGYTYFRFETSGGVGSTKMLCPDDVEYARFLSSSIKTDYNSRLPLVVFAPTGYEVSYRIWAAGVELYDVEAVNTNAAITAPGDWNTEDNPELYLNETFAYDLKTEGTELYYSSALGVGFTYDGKTDPVTGTVWKAMTDGAIINMSYWNGDTKIGGDQTVEVFDKDPSLSLEQALKEKFLQGEYAENCFVKTDGVYETLPKFPGYVAAGIAYPQPSDPDAPWWENSDKCPPRYSEGNWVSYFLMNSEVSGKYLFITLGQEPGPSDGSDMGTWSESIQILK